jgi:hypothetical protein
MDPQAAWDQMLAAYTAGEHDHATEIAHGLIDWLRRGGFPPVTTEAVPAGDGWHRAVTLAACTFILQQFGENA